MIASTQITNTEIFAFIPVPVSKLSSLKVCLQTKMTVETVEKKAIFKKIANSTGKLLQNYK